MIQSLLRSCDPITRAPEIPKRKPLPAEKSLYDVKEWEEIHQKLPTWKEIFQNTDVSRKRVLVNKLIERIDIRKDKINIRFKINLDEFLQSRMSMDYGVPE